MTASEQIIDMSFLGNAYLYQRSLETNLAVALTHLSGHLAQTSLAGLSSATWLGPAR